MTQIKIFVFNSYKQSLTNLIRTMNLEYLFIELKRFLYIFLINSY